MSVIAWATLIILAFIFIFVGLALVMFFAFYFNDGASPSFGIAIFLLLAVILAVIFPNFAGTPIIPASIIALSFLIAILGGLAHMLLPNIDNKDAIKAFQPLILFTIASGILVAVFNLAKVLTA